MTVGIYILTSPNNKSYVGQSIQIENRIPQHKNKDSHIGRAIKKYGFENFQINIIPIKEEQLDDYEKLYINILDSHKNGYNKTIGGQSEGTRHKKWNDNQIMIGSGHKGKKHTDEWKREKSIAMSGSNNPFFGKKHPPEILEQIRSKNKGNTPHNNGIPMCDETRERMRLTKIDKNGKSVMVNNIVYPTLVKAHTALGICKKVLKDRLSSDDFPEYQYIKQ